MSAEAWLSSIDKDKRGDKKQQQQRREKTRSALLSGSSDESVTASRGGTLTRQLLKAHDHAHLPLVRHGSGLCDEESSVYSVDQEGFYTSMHKDSGLKRSCADLILEEDVFASPALTDTRNINKKEKRRSLVGSGKKRLGKNKRTPPPPPPRDCSTLSKSNLTLHAEESGMTSPTVNKPMDRSQRAGSNDTSISDQSNNSRNKQYESASESDAEAIYARIKVKSSISAAAIPSLCSVTPLNSDEEDMDMLGFPSAWKSNGTSQKTPDTSTWTATSTALTVARGGHFTSTPNTNPDQRPKVADFSLTSDPTLSSFSITSMTKDDSFTEAEKAADSSLNLSDYSNGCSTWPRSPNNKSDSSAFGSLLKTVEKKPPRPQISQLFKSAEDHTGKGGSKITNGGSFKGSNDGSIGPSSSKWGGSTTTLSSIPSSTGDEPPNIPDKYRPSLTVRPKSRSGETAKGISVPEPIREHIYANVIVQGSPTSSGVETVSITKNTSHYATSSVLAKSGEAASTSTFTTSPYASGSLASSEASKSVSSRSANPPTTGSAISSPASSNPPSRALSPTGKVYAVPIPAPAKLIISSPVSGQVSFKENPYKRSVCSPVSTKELLSVWNSTTTAQDKDKCYNSLPRKPSAPSGPGAAKQQSTLNLSPEKKESTTISPIIITSQEFEYSTLPKKRLGGAFDHIHTKSATSTPMSPPPSQPLFPSISAMKHSVSFPITEKEVTQQHKQKEEKRKETGTYGGSWYDGIKTDKPNTDPDAITSLTSYMSAPPRSCFAPNRNSADSFTFGQRRDSIASTISSDSSGKSKGFLASILKSSPSGSKSSVKTDEDSVSIASSRSDEKTPALSSFTKPPSLGLPLGIKRTASVGSQGSESSGKIAVPTIPPTVPNSTGSSSTGALQANRPTSLAISSTSELGKRSRQSDPSNDQQDGQTEAKALVLTTINENEAPKSAKPPRPSPVRVVYPSSPARASKSPSPEAGPSFGKPKAKVIVSAQHKRSNDDNTQRAQSMSPKNEIGKVSWPSRNADQNENTKQKSLSTFAPVSRVNNSNGKGTLETEATAPPPPTRDSSLPRKSSMKDCGPTSANPSSETTVISPPRLSTGGSGVYSVSDAQNSSSVSARTGGGSAFSTTNTGLPRYPVFVKPKTSGSSTPPTSRPLSLSVASSGENNKTDVQTNGNSGSPVNCVETKSRSLSMSSNDSGNASKSTNLKNVSNNNLNRSTGSLASGLSLFSASNTNLNKSSLSLYKSSESLASTNSNHAERTRAAKLAFLSGVGNSEAPPPRTVDPFSRYKVGGRKSSTGSTTSSSSNKSSTSNGLMENTNNSNSGSENGTPTHKFRQSPPHGRFVASKIEQLRRKSVDTPPPSPESPSSGLGSSICSPLSPVKTAAGGSTVFSCLNGHQMAVNNNVKSVIPEKPAVVS